MFGHPPSDRKRRLVALQTRGGGCQNYVSKLCVCFGHRQKIVDGDGRNERKKQKTYSDDARSGGRRFTLGLGVVLDRFGFVLVGVLGGIVHGWGCCHRFLSRNCEASRQRMQERKKDCGKAGSSSRPMPTVVDWSMSVWPPTSTMRSGEDRVDGRTSGLQCPRNEWSTGASRERNVEVFKNFAARFALRLALEQAFLGLLILPFLPHHWRRWWAISQLCAGKVVG